MPQPQLHRRCTVGPHVEVRRNGLPVAALGRGCQTQQHTGPYLRGKGVETIGSQAVALVDDHRVPMLGPQLIQQLAAGDAVDGGKQVVQALRLDAASQ